MAVSEALGVSASIGTARVRGLVIVPVFALCYVPLIFAGYALKEDLSSLTIIWPARACCSQCCSFRVAAWPVPMVTAVVCRAGRRLRTVARVSLIFRSPSH